MNTYISQQVFPICMQSNQETPIPGGDNNALENFGPHEDQKSILKEQDIEENHKNLIGKSSDIRSHIKDGLLGFTPQVVRLRSESSSSLREFRFNDQEFTTGITLSNIKYNHPRF